MDLHVAEARQQVYDGYTVARSAWFSPLDQLLLQEVTTILQVHTISDIMMVDGHYIKEEIVDDILENTKYLYRWPWPL